MLYTFLSINPDTTPKLMHPQPLDATLYYLDGLPASGKSTLAKQLADALKCPIIETDAIAQQKSITYYQAAKQALYAALEHLDRGTHVVLDSFVIEDYLQQAETLGKNYNIRLIGLWCPLGELQKRFDQRSGIPGSWENCNLSQEYQSRYGDQSDISIIRNAGVHQLEGKSVNYDYFFDGRQLKPQEILQHILLRKPNPKHPKI